MPTLKSTLQNLVRRQGTAALTARFAGKDGIAVSVLCLTRDCSSYLDLCLGSLETQQLPLSRFEVLVHNNGSLDETGEVLEHFRERGRLNLAVESASEPVGEAGAWNRLVEKSRGGVLVFLSDTLISHPPLLLQHLMAHLEGETLLCGAPIPQVHSHLFPLQAFPIPNLRPSPLVSSREANWRQFLTPFVCSVEATSEQHANWMTFDLRHASVRRESYLKTGAFRGTTPREDLGNWGLLSLDFALRAQKANLGIRFLNSPAAWQSVKPGFVVASHQAQNHLNRFFANHPDFDCPAIEEQLKTRFLPPAIPAWSH